MNRFHVHVHVTDPVVGVLVEVPVMLAVVAVVNRSQAWYEAGLAPSRT